MIDVQLALAWPPDRWRDIHVVVACSGGPDSTALLRAMLALVGEHPARIIVSHFNHQWRGEDSDKDQQFVEELAAEWQLPCVVGSPEDARRTRSAPSSPVAPSPSKLDEATARQMRYDFLLETAHATGARHIVLGHTADDQAETILHHILRGTGLAGLAGMTFVRPITPDISLVRPLLAVRRHEVLSYLASLPQAFRIDQSNSDLAYTRNRIRHQLMPSLSRDYNESIVDSLLQLGEIARQTTDDLRRGLVAIIDSAVTERSLQRVAVMCEPIARLTHTEQVEFFRLLWRQQGWSEQSMGYAQWRMLVAMLQSPTACVTLPGSIDVRRVGEQLVFSCPRC